MTKVKVYAPNKAYAGIVGDIRFEQGVAEVDRDHKAMGYFKHAGYGIGKAAEAPVTAEPIDARDFAASQIVGTPLRDAAVDPRPGDFLPPTNAGEANPHGPLVVAPEIHGSGPAGIRPGETYVDDPARQEAAETALATTILVDGDPATVVSETFDATPGSGNMGPLGLSDPGSVEMGVEAARAARADDQAPEGDAPPKSASKAEWVAYAIARGMDESEADAVKKDVLIARYGG